MPPSSPRLRVSELSAIILRRRRKRAMTILARFRSGFYTTDEGVANVNRDARFLIDYDALVKSLSAV